MNLDHEPLQVIYEDDDLIAINKPHGLLVHKTNLARDTKHFALQLLRDQVGYRVYPAHRLDRKTSGVLLFAKSKEANAKMHKIFSDRKIKKNYLSIVRGWVSETETIDYPLAKEGSNITSEKLQSAMTTYELINKYETPYGIGKYKTSRYSYIKLTPHTGRFHQLRKHMSHIFHPIIGDRPHGCNKQNRLWKHQIKIDTMLLHAESLSFINDSGEKIFIKAELSNSFIKAKKFLELNNILPSNK